MPPCINIHTHSLAAPPPSVALYNHDYLLNTPPVNASLYSVGIHPWGITDRYEDSLKKLFDYISSYNITAIGEAGLDRAIKTPYPVQEIVFISQAALAAQYQKPMLIHAVRSYSDILNTRKKFADAPPWIIHGFKGNALQAGQLIKHGLYFSFGKHLSTNTGNLSEVFCGIDYNYVFFETDNDTISIEDMYLCASGLTGLSVAEWQHITANNFRKVFGFGV